MRPFKYTFIILTIVGLHTSAYTMRCKPQYPYRQVENPTTTYTGTSRRYIPDEGIYNSTEYPLERVSKEKGVVEILYWKSQQVVHLPKNNNSSDK